MEQNQSKFKNLMNNLTLNQKIGIVLGVVILVLILVLGVILMPVKNESNTTTDGTNGGGSSSTDKTGGANNSSSDDSTNTNESEKTYANPESTPISGGDKNDINTYLPHAVFVRENDLSMIRYYIEIHEDEPAVVYVIYSNCDTNAKALADEYLKIIPTELISNYTIKYEEFSEDSYCTK